MDEQATKSEDSSIEHIGSGHNSPLVLESAALLQGRRIVIIRHNGVDYRLIETRNGKLILQK